MTRSSGAREGDWKCSGCSNRNYAFRSLCNRCKQPRVLVDADTPPDSKWLPRLGDWICAGCSNNNYASREKCNKCGKLKDMVALPLSMAGGGVGGGVSPPPPPPFAAGPPMNVGLVPTPISLGSWNMNPAAAAALARNVRMNENGGGGGWRAGDWTCTCGYVNYASRTTCKQCHALPAIPLPQQSLTPVGYQVSGVKRQASEELSNDWMTKRPHVDLIQQAYMASMPAYGWDERSSLVLGLGSAGLNIIPSLGVPGPVLKGPPPNVGKGAKHWRVGDWICNNCDNHNYASRECCNRCGRDKGDHSIKA